MSFLPGRIQKQQTFLTSGTFVPDDALIAAGGWVTVGPIVGGGGGSNGNGGGGGGEVLKNIMVQLSGPVAVTIGAGGAASTAGGDTTFGAFVTARGGRPGHLSSGGNSGNGSSGFPGNLITSGGSGGGAGGPASGCPGQNFTSGFTAGGPGIDGLGGGGGGTSSVEIPGGGSCGGGAAGSNGAPNTGGGAGAGNHSGGSGLCTITWWE